MQERGCLIFDKRRLLRIKNDALRNIFEVADITKWFSKKSKIDSKDFVYGLVGNLIEALMLQQDLAIRISDSKPTPYVKKKILAAFQSLGYIDIIRTGYRTSTHSSLTIIQPHGKILDIFDPSAAKIKKAWSIVLRQGDKEMPVKTLSEQHELLYQCASKFQKHVNVPIHGFKRIFNSDLESGGRIYSNFQQMSKQHRQLIKIENADTIELDYPYNHLRMLFYLCGTKETDDPYIILAKFGKERKVIKKAFNVLLNSKHPIKTLCDARPNAYFKWSVKQAHTFVQKVYAIFPFLKKFEGSGIGLKFQKVEGDIALEIMKWGLYNNIVVLPVHDSFIIKRTESNRLKDIMDAVWKQEVSKFNLSSLI